jgi:hypothetical protein
VIPRIPRASKIEMPPRPRQTRPGDRSRLVYCHVLSTVCSNPLTACALTHLYLPVTTARGLAYAWRPAISVYPSSQGCRASRVKAARGIRYVARKRDRFPRTDTLVSAFRPGISLCARIVTCAPRLPSVDCPIKSSRTTRAV